MALKQDNTCLIMIYNILMSTACLIRCNIVRSFWCHHSGEKRVKTIQHIFIMTGISLENQTLQWHKFRSFLFAMWSWIKRHGNLMYADSNAFSVPSLYIKNQGDLSHYMWKLCFDKKICHNWHPLSMFRTEDKNPSQSNFISQIKLYKSGNWSSYKLYTNWQ